MRIRTLAWLLIGLAATAVLIISSAVAIIWGDLPKITEVQDIRLKEPLRIYTIDGKLIGEFGDERRITVKISDTPQPLIEAILAAEDDRFYAHHGIDIFGVARAIFANLKSMRTRQGASTITMQVARNYFLSREKTYKRKVKEALLAFRLERELEKSQILELYLNKIFLGHRAYGFQAASSFYYNKPLSELSLAQIAMLAGLPKAPSTSNPVSNPQRALNRRNYVLGRMHDLEFISDDKFLRAKSEPITANRHRLEIELEAPYVSEMVREYMFEQYGRAAYESGYRVYTTVDSNFQQSANKAIVDGLIAYGERRGFKGASGRIDPVLHDSTDKRIIELQKFPGVSNLQPVMVLRPGGDAIEILTSTGIHKSLSSDSWRWTNKSPSQLLHPGDVVYLFKAETGARLANIPKVQGALVSLSPSDGSILALTGGFSFRQSRFNRVTQAQRQPGSNIKPFIYSSAIANGFTASTLVSGAPIVIEDSIGGAWRPQNYSKKVFGPTRLRKALSLSLNLVSIRLVRALGIDTVRAYLGRFGFDSERLPKGLSLALGSATVTPLEIARGYASFANGGYLINPFLIARIEDQDGAIVEYANREMICPDCPAPKTKTSSNQNRTVDSRFAPRIISEENAFIVDSLMKEVVSNGTAKAALQLNRSDLAGKTGTTNNYFDAWFTGYNPDVVTSVWVGFDSPQDLGKGESGARAALPIWIDYMRVALENRPDLEREIPEKIVELRTNPISGLRATEEESDAYLEFFVRGSEPPFPDPESLIDPIQGLF